MSRPFQPHIITDDSASGGLRVEGSYKFDSSRANYIERVPTVDGNRRTWTYSAWVKFCDKDGSGEVLISGGNGCGAHTDDVRMGLYFNPDGALVTDLCGIGAFESSYMRFRDFGAWYHIVWQFDTTQPTGANRSIIYVNGENISLNRQRTWNESVNYGINSHNNRTNIGTFSNSLGSYPFDGYMTQMHLVDGRRLPPEAFGYTDAATGLWRPKKFDTSGPNNGTQWRNGVSGNIYSGSTSDLFDGKGTVIAINGNGNASNNHLTVSSVNVRAKRVGVRVSNSGSDITVFINGSSVGTISSGSMASNAPRLFEFNFDETLVSTIKIQRVGNASGWFLYEIQLDSIPLIDNATSNFGNNGFYLPMDGTTEIPLHDASGNHNDFSAYNSARHSVPLTKATGALPIMRTNKGGSIALTGVREDPYGSSCVVAVPGHSAFQDYSYQVGASSYKSFTTSGSPTISPEGSGQIGNQCLYRNSIKFTGSNSDYIEIPFNQFNLGTGDFTIECWANHMDHGTDMNLFNLYDGSSRKFFVQARVNNSADDLHVRLYGSGNQYNSNAVRWQNNDNTKKVWYHVAVTRASGTLRVYLNGVRVSANHNVSSENLGNVDRLRVGYMAGDGSKYWTGFVQDIRFYTAAKYTSNFAPPRGNSNLVFDSPSGVALPRQTDFEEIENGSVSLNAGTDALTIPNSSDFDLGSSWTIEFWFYPFDTTNAKVMGTRGDSSPRGWEIVYWDGGKIGIEQYGDQSTSGQQRGTKLVRPLAWHHVAITHNGTNTRTYIDGFADLNYTGSSGSNWGTGGHNLRIGRPENHAEGGRFAISNVRIVKGTVVYTTNFTPPTTPLTNITNTKLLCCNSKISTAHTTVSPTASGPSITAVGGITHSTDDPYSSSEGSTSNSGTGYLRSVSDSYIIGYGDFTIECWLKSTNAAGSNQEGIWSILSGSNDFSNTTANAIRFTQGRDGTGSGQDGGLEVVINQEAMGTTGQDVLAENVWTHVAVSRQSGLVKIFVGGVEKASAYLRSHIPGNRFITGYYDHNYTFQGNMADLRFVNGRAVYTGNFTPPTSPLPNVPNAVLRACSSDSSATSSATVYSIPSPAGNVIANHFNPFDVVDTIGQESGYCTWNHANKQSNVVLGDGGLNAAISAAGDGKCRGTLSFTKGKFYYEWTVGIASRIHIGVTDVQAPMVQNSGDFSNRNDEWAVRTDGFRVHNQTALGNEGYDINNSNTINATGYIWMVAVDADNGKIYFGKNGCWLAGADPLSGTNAAYDNLGGRRLTPACGRRTGANGGMINFGATPFVYPPPEGFKALCTSNLEDEPIIDPSQHFNVLTWTGNGSTGQNITGLKFKPDLLFIKKYNASESWGVFDSVRGVNKRLYANDSHAEQSETTMSAFNEGGFRVEGSGGGSTNDNGDSYVGYCWRAGDHDGNGYWKDGVEYAAKTDLVSGGITSQIGGISINTKAGFSIISFGGTGSSADLPHGLGKAPKFVLIKKYSAGGNSWAVYCDGPGAGPNKQILLNSSNAVSTDNNGFNAAPDETFVHLGSGAQMATNQNGQNIAYIWAEIPGYSRFGTYYGDNSSDGTYIHCGFRPRFFLWKVLGRTGGWGIIDTERDPINDGTEKQLGPDDADAQGSYQVLDITSTGIKMRNQWGDTNQNYDHLFMAFAEQPVSNPYGGQSNAR